MIILVLIFSLVLTPAWAALYYLAPDTGNNANAGTVCTSPIAGYSKAGFLAGLAAGDVVLQKAGTTYVGQLSPSTDGAAGNPIIFGVYVSCASPNQVTDGSSRAVIDANNASSGAVLFTSRSYLTMIGIDVQGSTDTTGTTCQFRAQQSTGIVVSYSTARAGTGPGKCGFTTNRGTTETYSFLSASGMSGNGFLLYGPTGGTATAITVQDSTFNANNTTPSPTQAGLNVSMDDETAFVQRMILQRNTTIGNDLATGNGIRVTGNVQNSTITLNTSTGNKYGLYFESTSDVDGTGDNMTGTVVSRNTANSNLDDGILVSRADFLTIGGATLAEGNTANTNGGASARNFGRGIEIVGTTANHSRFNTVRFNTANGNINPISNGSEGVGIGFDNYTDDSIMYGNRMTGNEGNGIQTFICLRCTITGNLLTANGTNFSGATVDTSIQGDLQLGSGSTTVRVINNTIRGACTTQARYGIVEAFSSTSTGTLVQNNLLIGCYVAGLMLKTTTTQDHNAFWQNRSPVISSADETVQPDGTGSIMANPHLLATGQTNASSPLRGAGVATPYCRDIRGGLCSPPFNIGAYQTRGRDPAPTRALRP